VLLHEAAKDDALDIRDGAPRSFSMGALGNAFKTQCTASKFRVASRFEAILRGTSGDAPSFPTNGLQCEWQSQLTAYEVVTWEVNSTALFPEG
jgi:hypothetical protein